MALTVLLIFIKILIFIMINYTGIFFKSPPPPPKVACSFNMLAISNFYSFLKSYKKWKGGEGVILTIIYPCLNPVVYLHGLLSNLIQSLSLNLHYTNSTNWKLQNYTNIVSIKKNYANIIIEQERHKKITQILFSNKSVIKNYANIVFKKESY